MAGKNRVCLGIVREDLPARVGLVLLKISRWNNGRTKPSPLAVRTLREVVAAMGDEGKDLLARFAQA